MSDAFDLMLGVFRSPVRSTSLRSRDLPDDVLEVIRVAAGDETAIAAARTTTRLDDADLQVAASLLLHNMFFFDGADSYRTLGVRPDASSSQIKKHYRWLVRWLHPDRNPDAMQTVFADRINRAWNSIRTEERRANYDRSLSAEHVDDGVGQQTLDTSAMLREWTQRPRVPLLSGRLVRRLPKIIAIGAGLIALAALGLAARVALLGPGRSGELPTTVSDRRVEGPEAPATLSMPASMPELQSAPPAAGHPLPEPSPVPASPLPSDAKALALATPRQGASSVVAVAPEAAAPSKTKAAASTRTGDTRGAPSVRHEATVATATTARSAETSAMASAPAVAIDPAPSSLSDTDVDKFIESFQRLYGADDVERFLALFSAQARGNSGDYKELAGDYRRLFAQRRQRRLSLSHLNWQIDGDSAAGDGNYEAWVGATADKPESRTHGQIMLQLTRGKDGLHITRLHHTVNK